MLESKARESEAGLRRGMQAQLALMQLQLLKCLQPGGALQHYPFGNGWVPTR